MAAMRSVMFVDRLELDFYGSHFSHALVLGDVDSDRVGGGGGAKDSQAQEFVKSRSQISMREPLSAIETNPLFSQLTNAYVQVYIALCFMCCMFSAIR